MHPQALRPYGRRPRALRPRLRRPYAPHRSGPSQRALRWSGPRPSVPSPWVWSPALLLAVLLVAAWLLAPAALSAQDPGTGPWLQYADAEEAGFSVAGLDAARTYADSVGSGAVLAVHRGRVIAAFGDVAREFEAHSVRKSLVSGLYGAVVSQGTLELDASLAELGIEEDGGLTETERSATVGDLLAARSGVYLPAAYAPSDQEAERPERGSHEPGSHWFYNNWDFNVAGVALERATGQELYTLFERILARPLGMEDWTPADGFLAYEPTKSRHPAHTFRISTRDLARFGQLYLQEGWWNGRQVIPADWIRESTRAHSDLGDGTGYGFMWWTYAAGALGETYPSLRGHDLYMGRGTGGQGLWVIPGAEMVIVHRGDTDHGSGVSGPHAWAITEMILAAKKGESASDPALMRLRPQPLASQLPALAEPEWARVPAHLLAAYMGHYRISPEVVARVFMFRGEPYIHLPGEGDARLFALSESEFTVKVMAGVSVRFQRDAAGRVEGVVLRMGPEEIRGERVR